MNINDFKSNFQFGARPSLFEVSIPSLGDGFKFRCKGTQLPSSTINQVTLPFSGMDVQLPGTRTFDPITFTIIEDINFEVRKVLEQWLDKIHDFESGQRGLWADIVEDVIVSQLKPDNSPAITYKLIDTFPQALDAIDLNWDNKDTVLEYSATFVYNYYKIV